MHASGEHWPGEDILRQCRNGRSATNDGVQDTVTSFARCLGLRSMAMIRPHTSSLSARLETDLADATLIARMRLLLAVSVLLAVLIEPPDGGRDQQATWLVLAGYVAHSGAVYLGTLARHPIANSRLMPWLDICWYAMFVLFYGGIGNYFFLFFLAILTASFRWGFEEGARITIASAILFALCHLPHDIRSDLSRLLLRLTFLLVFGYLSARWGESQVELKRRLVLLRNVSKLSNPRFGVEQTLRSTLQQTAAFFRARRCICVLPGTAENSVELLTLREHGRAYDFHVQPVTAEAVAPLLSPQPQHVLACTHAPISVWPWQTTTAIYDSDKNKWLRPEHSEESALAGLLEATSYISAPFSLRNRHGRLFIIAGERSLNKHDALFLHQINEQAFPVIDNIELLARMASDAAQQERKKIALDIHDTTLQPYIGLKLGLNALRNKASPDNPLLDDIGKLVDMTTSVITDLRHYSRIVRNLATSEPLLRSALLRQIAQIQAFYGVDIALQMDEMPQMNDRFNAEVVQLVREGLHNICKHSHARHGGVTLRHAEDRIEIDIVNEGGDAGFADFSPYSLTERAAALGGITRVREGTDGSTVVHIEIPI